MAKAKRNTSTRSATIKDRTPKVSKPRAKTSNASQRQRQPVKRVETSSDAETTLSGVAAQVRSLSSAAMEWVAPMADISLKLAARSVKSSATPAMLKKRGNLLRQTLESAGVTLQEVKQALTARDARMLEQAQGGTLSLPFEVILRLAGIFGRHDPISFIMKITRVTNPEIWDAMEKLGVGKLAAHAERERQFLNIYRASDAARELDDVEFAAVLKFVTAAFEAALVFKSSDE